MTANRDTSMAAVPTVLTGVVIGLVVLSSASAPAAILTGSPWDTPAAAVQQVDDAGRALR